MRHKKKELEEDFEPSLIFPPTPSYTLTPHRAPDKSGKRGVKAPEKKAKNNKLKILERFTARLVSLAV